MEGKTICAELDMERLVEEYGSSMLRLCCAYLKDLDLAQDAVQDSFLKLYRAAPVFQSPQQERAWVMRVTANVCRDLLRSAWRRKVSLTETLPDRAATASAHPGEISPLAEAVLGLRPLYREVIVLHYYLGYPIKDISQLLHAPQPTVSVRLSRARSQLKKALA